VAFPSRIQVSARLSVPHPLPGEEDGDVVVVLWALPSLLPAVGDHAVIDEGAVTSLMT